MAIPLNWEYKNPSFYESKDVPNSFGMYDNFIGAFQISCKEITDHIKDLIKTRNLPVQSSESKGLEFAELPIKAGKKFVYTFCCAVDDHFIFATYIIDSDKNETEQVKSELLDVRRALTSLNFIKPEFRSHVIAARRLHLFMLSIAATNDLRNKAIENGSFIELVILTANSIDALLRLSIILTEQIKNMTNEINTSFLFQDKDDKPIMERAIYKLALDQNIITIEIFGELEQLYSERNKVVHRYIITDIRTEDVLNISMKYYELDHRIGSIVNNLEQRQSELNIGVHGNNKNLGHGFDEPELKLLMAGIRDKHGRINLNK